MFKDQFYKCTKCMENKEGETICLLRLSVVDNIRYIPDYCPDDNMNDPKWVSITKKEFITELN